MSSSSAHSRRPGRRRLPRIRLSQPRGIHLSLPDHHLLQRSYAAPGNVQLPNGVIRDTVMGRADVIGKQRGDGRRFQPGFNGRFNFRRPVEQLRSEILVDNTTKRHANLKVTTMLTLPGSCEETIAGS